jgi:hypothetical protein
MSKLLRPLAALLVLNLLATPVLAQDDEDMDPPGQEKVEPDAKKYEEAIKDAKKYEGAFTLYVRKSELLLELPEANLDRLFLAQATLYSGFGPMDGQAGNPLSEGPVDVFKFVRKDERILLVRPNTKHRWDKDDPLATASERTFPEAILAMYRIEQKHPEKKLLLVNLTSFFQGTVFDLPKVVAAGAGGPASPDRELSDLDTIKNRGDMTVVRMNMHYRSQGGGEFDDILAAFGLEMPSHLEDKKSIPFKLTYTLWYRDEKDYMPRLSDDRVGYFTQDFFSVSRFDKVERTERYITRFDLRKKDPFAGVSEPVEPIVWYIDSSVPKKYRPGVRAGILAWNEAFEKIGFKDAIVVKDGPENDPDWDHADGTHNVVRWNMSEDAAYAVAFFRVDPLSGRVMNAAVSVDANYPTAMLNEYNYTVRQASVAARAALSEKVLLRSGADELDPLHMLVNGLDPKVEAARRALESQGWSRGRCEYAKELAQSSTMAWAILKANGSKVSEEDFMFQFMADLVMHEVGHCLGLRHNFAGSTNLTVLDLLNDAKVKQSGLSASVMDYTPVNTPAVLRGNGVFFNAGPGPYDKWAIEYGYSPSNAKSPDEERTFLGLIARRSGEPGHTYLTDEDADGMNPLAVRFDLASDTLEWIKTDLKGNGIVRNYAINGLVKEGEDYSLRTRIILATYLRNGRSALTATRFVGGVEMRRMHKGDVGEKPTLAPVDPKRQRQAMKLIIENVLMTDRVSLSADVMTRMNMDPMDGEGGNWNAPLRAIIGGNQIAVLSALMSANKIDDILENDFKMEGQADRYTVSEHFNWMFAAVFKEVGQNKNITSMRRDLQRFMVNGLILQAGAPSRAIADDVRVVCSQGLARLKVRFDEQAKNSKGLDEMTVLHLKDMSASIDRFQKRVLTGR